MAQKINNVLLLILIISQACNMSSKEQSQNHSDKINKNAPFYTHVFPNEHPRISKRYDSTKIEKFWPFIIYKDGSYMVASELEEDSIYKTYVPLFEKYGGEGNGYNWAAILKVILKKENPDLIKHLDFDPEGGGFYLFADNENDQRQFASFASMIFKNKSKLIKYLTEPDKEKALKYDPKD